jgi:hypothetical protein
VAGSFWGLGYNCDIKGIAPAILGSKKAGIIGCFKRINSSGNYGMDGEKDIFRKIGNTV